MPKEFQIFLVILKWDTICKVNNDLCVLNIQVQRQKIFILLAIKPYIGPIKKKNIKQNKFHPPKQTKKQTNKSIHS